MDPLEREFGISEAKLLAPMRVEDSVIKSFMPGMPTEMIRDFEGVLAQDYYRGNLGDVSTLELANRMAHCEGTIVTLKNMKLDEAEKAGVRLEDRGNYLLDANKENTLFVYSTLKNRLLAELERREGLNSR